MQDLGQRREEDDDQEQDDWYMMDRSEAARDAVGKVNRDNIDDDYGQEETDFGGTPEAPDPLDEFFRIKDEQKVYYFKKFLNLPLRRDMEPELFLKTDFIGRKRTNSITKIEYNGKEIYYFRLGEIHKYANNRN